MNSITTVTRLARKTHCSQRRMYKLVQRYGPVYAEYAVELADAGIFRFDHRTHEWEVVGAERLKTGNRR